MTKQEIARLLMVGWVHMNDEQLALAKELEKQGLIVFDFLTVDYCFAPAPYYPNLFPVND